MSIIKYKYDSFIIWGHGLKFSEEILEIIDDKFPILNLYKYRPKSMPRFVKQVYSHDYAPYSHLLNKTKYLLKVAPEVMVVTVLNERSRVEIFGEGNFKHRESIEIKELKETLRDMYNPRKAGIRTENYIIHGTDTEEQTDAILKLIGLREGVNMYKRLNLQLPFRYYYPYIDSMKIIEISIDKLFCNLFVQGNRKNEIRYNVPLEETPHWGFVKGEEETYKKYLNNFFGRGLNSYHSVAKFRKLNREYDGSVPIVIREVGSNFLILDGLHRATILKGKGYKKLKAIKL
jgi:hypothetical protein